MANKFSSFYSKNEWVSLKRDDPIPESAWVKGGDVKMIVHGYALKGKYSEKYVQNLWLSRALNNSFTFC